MKRRADYEVGTLESKVEVQINDAVKSIETLIGSLGSLKSSLNSTLEASNNNNIKDDADNLAKTFNTLRKAVNFSAIYVGAKKIWNYAKGISSDYIDMVETSNLFEVSMGKVVDQYGKVDEAQSEYYNKAIKFQNDMNESLLTNRAEMEKYQAMYFSMLKSQNINKNKSYFMSENLTKAGYDIASLYNLDVSDAMNKLKSGLAGQVESLRKIGIDVSESALQNVLNEAGIDRKVQQLSYAEKEIVRYNAIMQQASQAQGDFVKTMDNSANQIKMFKNQLAELRQVAGAFIVNTFGGIITYATAVIMVVKEILKAFANLFGYDLDTSGTTGLSGVSDTVGDIGTGLGNATKKAKEFKKQIMSFDEIHNIEVPTSSGGSSGSGGGSNYGIDSRLLENLKGWDNKMEGIKSKASEIRDKMLEWLGFKRDDKGGWKLEEGYTNFEKILDIVKMIGLALLAWKVSDAVTGIFGKLGILNGTQSFQIAFGLTLTLSGIFAQWKGTKHLLNGNVDLFSIMETLLGTTGGTFGIASILSATKLGKTLALPNRLAIGLGVMLTIQGIQILIDGIKKNDWKEKILGRLETSTGAGVTIGFLKGSWVLGLKTALLVAIGSLSFEKGLNIGNWLKENYGDSINWYIKKFNLDLDKDNLAIKAIKIAGIILGTIGDAIIDGLKNVGKWVAEKAKKIGEDVINGVKDGMKILATNPIFTAIKEAVQKVIDTFKSLFGIHSPSTVMKEQIGQNLILGLIEGIKSKIEDLKTKVKEVAGNVIEWFKGKIEGIREQGKTVISKIRSGISEKVSDLKDKVKEIGGKVKDWFDGKIDKLSGSGKNIISNIKTGISEKVSSLKEKVQEIAGKVKDWAGSKIKEAKEAGKNIATGISNGIENAKSTVKTTITTLGGNIVSWFKQKLNIKSPSRVMRDMVGKFIPLGIAEGIDEESKSVYSSIKELTQGIIVNTKDIAIDTNQYIDYGAINGQIQTQSSVSINDSISDKVAQASYNAFIRAMRDEGINVNIEAKTEEGIIVKKASEGFRDYVIQTGELPFPVPV